MQHTRACLSVSGQASHLGQGCNLISHGGEGKGGGEGVLKFEMGGLHFLRRKRGES